VHVAGRAIEFHVGGLWVELGKMTKMDAVSQRDGVVLSDCESPEEEVIPGADRRKNAL
jgi:hypothetical protein